MVGLRRAIGPLTMPRSLRNLQKGRSSKSGAGPAPSAVALDPPLTAAMLAAGLGVLAFSPYRLSENYLGSTIRLIRVSDGVEQDFGFDNVTGVFNDQAVHSWRDGSAVRPKEWICQITGQRLAVVQGTQNLIEADGSVGRFGTDMAPLDGQLSRSPNKGAIGFNLAGLSALQLLNSGINVSIAGCEMHLLWSPNNRKKSTIDNTDPVSGGSTTRENIICYGANSTNQFFHYIAGGTTADLVRVQGGAAQAQPNGLGMPNHRWKAKSQWVTGYLIGNAAYSEYSAGRVTKSPTAYPAATATAIQGGSLDNGALCIGSVFSGATTALGTTNRGDFLFGGLIVTKALTPAQRWLLQAKLSAIGQMHRVKPKADIEAYFDEIVLMKNANGAGRVVGNKSKLTVDFDLTGTQTAGTPTPNEGLIGIKNPNAATLGNSYKSTDNFFAEAITGTVVRLAYQEQNGSGTIDGGLQWDIAMSAGDPKVDTRSEWSFGLGYNHATNCLWTKPAGSYDGGRGGNRKTSTGADFGVGLYEAQSGGGGNQEHGKYYPNTVNRSFIHNESFGSPNPYTWTDATWAQTDPARPFDLDGPVIPNCPDDISYGWRANHLALHIGTFEAPAGYNRSEPFAVNLSKIVRAKGRSWVSGGAIQPMGHLDGSYARNDYTGVKHSADNHCIQSVPWQYQFQGTRVMWAFKAGEAFTAEKIEEVQVNAYKLVA